MPPSKRPNISEWRAPEPATLPRHQRSNQRRPALDLDLLAETLELLVERQAGILDDLRRLNDHYLPVSIQPQLSHAIKSADHVYKHTSAARTLLDLEQDPQ